VCDSCCFGVIAIIVSVVVEVESEFSDKEKIHRLFNSFVFTKERALATVTQKVTKHIAPQT